MNGDGKRRRERTGSYRNDPRSKSKQKLRLGAEEQLESKLGFSLFTEGDKRLGWLLTFSPVPILFLLSDYFFGSKLGLG
jgi:DNA polymerase epsilon subunit 1